MFHHIFTDISTIKWHLQRNFERFVAMSLKSFAAVDAAESTRLGAMLFSRFVSGTRVVSGVAVKKVADIEFFGYGSHSNVCCNVIALEMH